jgi:hypothetical protein
MRAMPCGSLLLEGLLVVERERALWARQLLYCGQWHECSMLDVSCGDVQRGHRLYSCECLLGVPCWRVLLEGMQLVERERAVRCRQLLNGWQRQDIFMQCLPRWQILSCSLQQLEREWSLRGWQLLDRW